MAEDDKNANAFPNSPSLHSPEATKARDASEWFPNTAHKENGKVQVPTSLGHDAKAWFPASPALHPKTEQQAKPEQQARPAQQAAPKKETEGADNTNAAALTPEQKEWNRVLEGWVTEVRNDKEIGGAEFEATVSMARSVVGKYGTDAFKQLLNESGWGNHPEVIRVLTRVGRALKARNGDE